MEIPFWAWLVAGGFMTLVSWTVGDLEIFFYLGIMFVVFGLLKLFILGRPKKAQAQPTINHRPQHHMHPHAAQCPRCHMTISIYDRFCRNCGVRLRQ